MAAQEAALDREYERLRWFAAQRDKLLAAASDKEAARRIWNVELARFADEPRLRTFKATLLGRGLCNAGDVQDIGTEYRDPILEAEQRQAAREKEALRLAVDKVLAASSDKGRALQLYNETPGPRSWHKLDSWVRECVTKGLLGVEWLPGTRTGAKLHSLREKLTGGKALDGFAFNKALDGPEANK